MRRPIPVAAGDRRQAAQVIYRIVTLSAIPVAVLAAFPNEWINRPGIYSLYVAVVFAIPMVVVPILAILALIGSVALWRDWRFALPAWICLIAIGMGIVDLFVFQGQANLLLSAFHLIGVSLLVAAWAGWWLRLEPH